MTRCPSDLELERLARRPDDAAAAHVFSCARCAARVAELRRLSEEFEREVLPATVEAVVARAARPRVPRAVRIAGAAAAVAAAILIAVLAGRRGRDGEGAAIDLLAWAWPEATALTDGQRIPAGAGLRLEIRPRRACTLWVAAADAAGSVTRIYPPKAMTGTQGLPVQAGQTVPVETPARPGGAAGAERYFAVCLCGADPLHWKDVDRAARTIGPGEAQLRAARVIPGLPGDTLQATLLVERAR